VAHFGCLLFARLLQAQDKPAVSALGFRADLHSVSHGAFFHPAMDVSTSHAALKGNTIAVKNAAVAVTRSIATR
jgi:hypothetical protein